MNISEVSEKMDLPASTIRYYERISLIPPITRNDAGIRTFTEDDLGWVDFVRCMRAVGLSVEVLKKYVELVREGEGTIRERQDILVNERENLTKKKEELEELEEVINLLSKKINNYENHLLGTERSLN